MILKKKKPPTKKEKPLPAAPLAYGRLRRPSSLLLLSRFFRVAAPPDPFRFSSSSPRFFGGCAASHYPALSWAAGAAPPLSPLSFLSIKQLTILSVARCNVLFQAVLAGIPTVTRHELICSPLDFASARHPKGPLSKATGFLHILP